MVREPIRERLRSLDRREMAGLALVAALVLAGVVFWYVRSLPSAVHIEGTLATGGGPGPAGVTGPPAATPSRSPSPSRSGPSVLVVHVAGWVKRPGVYELPAGERVIDALRKAGGAREGADLTSVNLAAVLTDAEQIVIARQGATSGPPASGTSDGGGGSGGGASGGGLININTATLDQLEELPGIGPSLGQRIIDYREQHGPFTSVEELTNVSGIGDVRLEDIRSKVTV